MIRIHINHDHDTENPCDWEDSWSLYSFNNRHASFRDPDSLDIERLRDLAERGLAFRLSYFEHGRCCWSLAGEGSTCEWDSVSFAGWLVWEGDESHIGGDADQRREDARSFLETYTDWCNGDCYYVASVERIPTDDTGEGSYETDADVCCGGFIGMVSVLDYLRECDPEYVGRNVELIDEHAGDVTSYYLPLRD